MKKKLESFLGISLWISEKCVSRFQYIPVPFSAWEAWRIAQGI